MKLVTACWLFLAALAHAAGLEFENPFNEVHAAPDAKTMTSDFKFTNKSSTASVISKADPTCSCTKVEVSGGKLNYAPGESGLIRVTLDMGNFSGTVDKEVPIWIDNDPPQKPSVVLKIRVHIPILVEIEPKTLKWDIDGKGGPQTIKIAMHGEKPIKILNVNATSGVFTNEIKTIEEGAKYELVVTPKSVKDPALCVIRIETDCSIPKHRTQQAFAVVRKPMPSDTAAKP